MKLASPNASLLRFALWGTLGALGACAEPPLSQNSEQPAAASAGPRVVWDLGAQPLPELPLPNDVVTQADPRSPTGLRLNVPVSGTTDFERNLRAQFNELDGWGTFSPLTVRFDAPLDLAALARRHPRESHDFRDDALYLVDLETGIPVPLDVGQGRFPIIVPRPEGWMLNDPRAGGNNVLLSTTEEDRNGDGILQLEEDTNFDGVLQRASVFPAGAAPNDGLTTHWEAETNTLLVRPLVPLRERHRYAVVLTDRLMGTNGPVRSPFDALGHPLQLPALRALQGLLDDDTLRARFYGDLRYGAPGSAGPAGARVAFAWTFTTQTTVTTLQDVERGLRGEGPYSSLASVSPATQPVNLRRGTCDPTQERIPYVVTGDELRTLLRTLSSAIGLVAGGAVSQQFVDALIQSFDWVDRLVILRVQSPYLSGAPRNGDPDARWQLDQVANGRIPGTDSLNVWVWVPRVTSTATQPFPVLYYPHGYGLGALQSIAFAGYFARYGLATVATDAPEHGFAFTAAQSGALRNVLGGMCLQNLGQVLSSSRASDVNGDGRPDPGANFLSAHMFHTRDMVRQTALDYLQISRALTEPAFSAMSTTDYNADGRTDLLGDFDGNGTIDVGGTAPFYMWGESLGGITSMVTGAIDPRLRAVAPISGGAGLIDVGLRTTVEGVGSQVISPALGPALTTVPASQRSPTGSPRRTACQANQFSLRFLVPDADRVGELEVACWDLGPNGAFVPGDDVVVGNARNNTIRCARVQPDGKLFIPLAADAGDPLQLIVYQGHAVQDFRTCAAPLGAPERNRLQNFAVTEGDCDEGCGHVPADAPADSPARRMAVRRSGTLGPSLVAPSSGLGLRRQTAEFRRFLTLAATAVDAGDPAVYAPLFLRGPNPRPLLVMTTAGDNLVPVATGVAFARAAGVMPFLDTPTGTWLDEFASPAEHLARFNGRNADFTLVDRWVLEGLSRTQRTPVMADPGAVFDADDLDDGMQLFTRNGTSYSPPQLSSPMRLVRAASAVRPAGAPVLGSPDAAAVNGLWRPAQGAPLAAYLTAYIDPHGAHTFLPPDPGQAWNAGAYLTNLTARFFQSQGRDLPYYSSPQTAQCLATTSCSFIPR